MTRSPDQAALLPRTTISLRISSIPTELLARGNHRLKSRPIAASDKASGSISCSSPSPFAVHWMILGRQPCHHPARAIVGPRQILPIDRRHDRLILRTGLAGLRREILVIPMIETRQAVENIDEILDVPGIDAIYVGPPILPSRSARRPNSTVRMPSNSVCTRSCWRRAENAASTPAFITPNQPYAARMIRMGFRLTRSQQQRTDGPSCAGGGRRCLVGSRRVSIGTAFSLRLVPPRRGLTGPLFGGARDRDCRRSAASFEVACGLPPLERNSLDFQSYRYGPIESRFFPGPPQIEAQAAAATLA